MLNKTLIAAAIAALFALPMAATAAEKSSGPSATSSGASSADKSGSAGNGGSASMMKRLDTDKDGSVSRDEAKKDSNISKRFKELDKDNDGKLSATELNAAQATGAGGSTKGMTDSPAGKASSAQGSATEGPRKGN